MNLQPLDLKRSFLSCQKRCCISCLACKTLQEAEEAQRLEFKKHRRRRRRGPSEEKWKSKKEKKKQHEMEKEKTETENMREAQLLAQQNRVLAALQGVSKRVYANMPRTCPTSRVGIPLPNTDRQFAIESQTCSHSLYVYNTVHPPDPVTLRKNLIIASGTAHSWRLICPGH